MSELQNFILLLKDVVTILSASTVAIVAVLGLRTWKNQLRGKTEYELARRLLKAVYRVRSTIGMVRAPLIFAGEARQALREAGIEVENPLNQDAQPQTEGAVYQRWDKLQEALTELNVEACEAEALWGQDIQNRLGQLGKNVTTLRAKIALYLYYLNHPIQGVPDEKLEVERDIIQRTRRIIYAIDEPEQDGFGASLQTSIKEIEDYLRQYLVL
jgi:hypothetical protein